MGKYFESFWSAIQKRGMQVLDMRYLKSAETETEQC